MRCHKAKCKRIACFRHNSLSNFSLTQSWSHVNGHTLLLQEVAQGCKNDPACQAFSYLDQGCCSNNTSAIGFRKTLPNTTAAYPTYAAQQCPLLSPYARLYVMPDKVASFASSGSDSSTGAIVGGGPGFESSAQCPQAGIKLEYRAAVAAIAICQLPT